MNPMSSLSSRSTAPPTVAAARVSSRARRRSWRRVVVVLTTVLAATAVAVGTGTLPAVAAGPDYVGLVVNGGGSSVSVINTNTMAVTKTITGPLGMEFSDARAIAITPDGTRALVVNDNVSYVSVITMSTLTVTSTINLAVGSNGSQAGGNSIAITPDGTTAMVSIRGTNSVVPINVSTLTAGAKITTPLPNGIAITPDGTKAYVSNDTTTTAGFTQISISGAGVLTLGTTVAVACQGARGLTIHPSGATLYLVCHVSDTLVPIALPSRSPGTPIAIGNNPVGVAASPNGAYVYVAIHDEHKVRRLTVDTGIVTTFAPYDRAFGVAVAPDSGTAIVTKSVYGQIQSLVEPAGTSVQTTVGAYPYAVAITPDQAPVASFTATTAAAGTATTFNAAASTVAYGSIARYDWDFGDGTTLADGGPTPSHTYPSRGGSYTARVTETSSAGTSTTQTFTGQTVSNNGGPSATTTRTVTVTGHDPLALVVNNGSNTVTVLNARTLATVETITGPTGMLFAAPTSIAITPDGSKALVGNDTQTYVSVITMSTLTVTSTINLGTGTAGAKIIAITPDGTTALVTNKTTNTVTPITGLSGTPVVGTPVSLGTGAGPFNVVITPDGTTAYIVNANGGTLVPFTVATRTLGTAISLQGTTACLEPRGLAITPNGATLYVTCQNSARVKPVNLSTKVVGAAITVSASPVGIVVTPDGALAYATANGALTRITVATGVPTALTNAAFGLTHNAAVTPDGVSVIFPKYAIPGAVFNLNVAAGTTTTTAGANNPYYVAITPDQAPVASFTAPAVTLGSPTSFDAQASTVAFGTIASYAWNFGDGNTLTTATPTTTHTYANPGSYTATVTETSSAGTSTTDVFTGQTMSRNGASTAVTTRTVTVNNSLGWTVDPGNIGFALTLNGQSQTTTATMPLKVAGGVSNLGWSISATSTTFTSGQHTLPSTAVTVQTAPTRSCDSTCTLASTSVPYPYTLPAGATAPAATKIYNATANTGMGSQTVIPTFSLTIPPTTRAGTYASTWTYTLSSGP